MKSLVITGMCLILFVACSGGKQHVHESAPLDRKYIKGKEVIFKHWLKDTLVVLSKNTPSDYIRKIDVNEDSTWLTITNSYKLKISRNYKGTNYDLIAGLGSLTMNKISIPKEFIWDYEMEHNYVVSVIKEFKYDFYEVITRFNLIYNDSIFKYGFSRGNLTDKKVMPSHR
jgi:hypothetical protein